MNRDGRGVEEDAKVVAAIIAGDGADGALDEGGRMGAVGKDGVEGERERRVKGGGGALSFELKTGAAVGGNGEGGVDVGAEGEDVGQADEVAVGPDFDGGDLRVGVAAVEPAFNAEGERIAKGAGERRIE